MHTVGTFPRAAAVMIIAAAAIAFVPVDSWGSTQSAEVRSGPLGHSGSDVAFVSVSLDGSTRSVTASPSAAWRASNARGTDAGWDVNIAALGDLASAAGTVETTERVIEVAGLSLAPGTAEPGPGSDPATNLSTTSVALSTSAQTYLVCSSACKGRYDYTPVFTLIIPADTYRSNYSGAVGSSALNPYVVTLSLTIA